MTTLRACSARRVNSEVISGGAITAVDLVFGEVFGVERAAREVAADYPEVAWVMGSSFAREEPNFSVFDTWMVCPFNCAPFPVQAVNVSSTSG